MTPELTSKPSAFAWTRSSPAIEVTHSSVCVSPGQYENPPLDNCLEYSDVSISGSIFFASAALASDSIGIEYNMVSPLADSCSVQVYW